jgi:putative tryptophan/tyrosine transport system substrate-binding protein
MSRGVAVEYRWAEGQYDRLAALVAELVRRQVAVIVAAPTASALAAKSATATIPIVFTVGDDPVKLGLVSSLARPGGNLTGVNFFGIEVVSKRLELLRGLIPGVGRLAVLVNPNNAAFSETTVREVEAAARGMGLEVQVFNASTSREIDAAFANLVRERSDAVFVGGDAFFSSRRVQLATLAARYMIPSSFSQRDVTEVGGLMSYGANFRDTYRQVGVYAGRILKGAKPAELPVVQSSKFELVINAQTARMLSLTVPASLLAIADEVIE